MTEDTLIARILRQVPVERDIYLDRKPVREAMGAAYLAVLEAINEALGRRGVTKRELPKSVDAYRAALLRYLAAHNGKLMREFESLYDLLHIAGYDRDLLRGPEGRPTGASRHRAFHQKDCVGNRPLPALGVITKAPPRCAVLVPCLNPTHARRRGHRGLHRRSGGGIEWRAPRR